MEERTQKNTLHILVTVFEWLRGKLSQRKMFSTEVMIRHCPKGSNTQFRAYCREHEVISSSDHMIKHLLLLVI